MGGGGEKGWKAHVLLVAKETGTWYHSILQGSLNPILKANNP